MSKRCCRAVLAAGFAALFPPVIQSAAPSFDCDQAGNEIERLICSDPKLSALDLRMAELFSDAMKAAKTPSRAELLAEQRGWLKNRNSCLKRTEPRRNCVLEHYSQRNSRLEELLTK